MREIELAYAGGIVDGEGSIGIYPHSGARGENRTHPPLRAHVSVSQCDVRLPLWLKARFGGYINEWKPKKDYHRIPWIWQITGTKQCLPFLETLLPYLMLKRQQAEIAIAFCKQQVNIRHLPQAEKEIEYAKRLVMVGRIKALNHRGPTPAETKRSGTEKLCDSPNCTETNVQKPTEMEARPQG